MLEDILYYDGDRKKKITFSSQLTSPDEQLFISSVNFLIDWKKFPI